MTTEDFTGPGATSVTTSVASAIIENGAKTTVSSGGVISAVTVMSGGFLYVGKQAETTDGVGSQGIVSGGIVSSGGVLTLYAGGLVENVEVQAGMVLVSSGAVASSLMLDSGVTEMVYGVDSGAILTSTVTQTIYSHGSAVGATVESGGVQNVNQGGSAISTTVIGGGSNDIGDGGQTVADGGYASHTTITNYGNQDIQQGGSATDTTVVSGGTQIIEGGASATNTTVSSGGIIQVSDNGSLTGATVESGGVLSATDTTDSPPTLANVTVQSGGDLVLNGTNFTITGLTLASGAEVDLTSFNYTSGVPTVTVTGDTATISGYDDSGDAVTQAFSFADTAGTITASEFQLANDGSNGSTLTYVACYCLGTLIAIENGEAAIETLRIGDHVRTSSGALRRIRWIGHRSYAPEFVRNSRGLLPIVIRANALADNVPRRDLRVSPLHAMYLDGVLIPASSLLNGRTIVQQDDPEQIDYFHLELESHDILLAEGAASESYLEEGGRGIFHNAADFYARYPDSDSEAAVNCAPRVEAGERLLTIWNRLNERALSLEAPRLEGHVAHADIRGVSGWFSSVETASQPFDIVAVLDGNVVAKGSTQDAHFVGSDGREELRQGFTLTYQAPLDELSARQVVVCRTVDKALLTPGITAETPSESQNGTQAEHLDPARFHGWVDHIAHDCIGGWAWNEARPWDKAQVDIVIDGVRAGTVFAADYRADLVAAGIGNGWAGFRLMLDTPLDWREPHVIEVFHAGTELSLNGSPARLHVPENFDASMCKAIERAVQDLDNSSSRRQALTFILNQADRIRQQEADLDARREETALLHRERKLAGPAAAEMPVIRRALVIGETMPRTGDNPDALPLLSHMRSLVRLGYDVTFTTVDSRPCTDIEDMLEREGITVARAPIYGSPEDVLKRQAGTFEVVYLRGLSVASSYAGLARRHMNKAKVIYGMRSLQYARIDRQATVEGRMDLKRAIGRLRTYEVTTAIMCDQIIVHSTVEAEMLRGMVSGLNVHVAPWEMTVDPVQSPASTRNGVAFVGNYDNAAALDAAMVLVRDVMPLVWARLPHVRCVLAGHGQASVIRRLAMEADATCGGVEVLGPISDLRDDLFGTVRLGVAPLRYGAGVASKVVETFAAGLPCVMSPTAAEGLIMPERLSGLVQDDVAAIAEQIIQLHENPEMAEEYGLIGCRMIGEEYSVGEVDRCLGQVFGAREAARPAAEKALRA
ncbi:Hint domain-containing protein [Acetobacter conturbans]|uniref:Glycosyltransferase n=1 Tax=Acetobacter conturbans TaxID=1737472 RepID=A0ABX0K0H2_9PROT|nr:Hint domain-containing protein [Acetobacter conturbans]NHN89222.1 glycosyltransferase [Acetobacter conturbans]